MSCNVADALRLTVIVVDRRLREGCSERVHLYANYTSSLAIAYCTVPFDPNGLDVGSLHRTNSMGNWYTCIRQGVYYSPA